MSSPASWFIASVYQIRGQSACYPVVNIPSKQILTKVVSLGPWAGKRNSLNIKPKICPIVLYYTVVRRNLFVLFGFPVGDTPAGFVHRVIDHMLHSCDSLGGSMACYKVSS